jgi:hypothetical protein
VIVTKVTGKDRDLAYYYSAEVYRRLMHSKSLTTKLIAVFLVAFVCLNAGGAMCVAYCQSVLEKASVLADHCPLKKKAAHCDPVKSEEGTSVASLGSNEIDCCPMTVSFIGAPIEKRNLSFEAAAISLVAAVRAELPAVPARAARVSPPAYRGPPLDRRVERVKNCIIRI